MKVFVYPVINGTCFPEMAVQLPSIPDYIAYGAAMEVHQDASYVEQKLDGEGSIDMPLPGGHAIMRYNQEVWQEDQPKNI